MPVPVAYFLRIPNVGDRVNADVAGKLAGRETRWTSDHNAPHLLAIGSVMNLATPHSQVWGTGVMHPDLGLGAALRGNIRALRGKETYQALRKGGRNPPDTPLGDPGFLAPGLLSVSRSKAPQFRVGLVSHYVDRRHPVILDFLRQDGVCDLNVHDSPRDFLARMANCEVILSSSLHGLIFAEALGLPNLWIRATGDLAGGDFKFRDWFSTTARPQAQVCQLDETSDVFQLAGRAEVRESKIDADALAAAFPAPDMWLSHAESASPGPSPPRTLEECRDAPLPVFLISYNRGGMLLQAIAGLRSQSMPVEIIVHDNGSTDPATLRILADLEGQGTKVYRNPPIKSADDLNQVNESVRCYFADWAEPSRYAVSDCDVDLSIADPSALHTFDELLNVFRKIASVGPMLRIRDIPWDYPLRNRAINRHIDMFWRHQPEKAIISSGEVAYRSGQIDTTFAVHRAGEPFRRLKTALRIYEPYEARHLDWHVRPDETYARTSSADISHWNNASETARYAAERLEHNEFFAVRRSGYRTLETYIASTNPEGQLVMEKTLAADCGGPYDLAPEHMSTCWESKPTSNAEYAIMSYLRDHPAELVGKRMLHVGFGNCEIPLEFGKDLSGYVGITISQPELDHYNQTVPQSGKYAGLILNKYDSRMYDQLDGSFDLIIDTLLKSYACCEKHFGEMMQLFADRLSPGGKIITTLRGIRFGWPGNVKMAHTPGSQADPDIGKLRTLTDEEFSDLARRIGLAVQSNPLPFTRNNQKVDETILMMVKPA